MPLILIFLLLPGLLILAVAWHRSNELKRQLAVSEPFQHEYVVDVSYSPQMNLSERRAFSALGANQRSRHAELLRSSVAEIAAKPGLAANINHVVRFGPVHQLGLLEVAAQDGDEAKRRAAAEALGQLRLLGDPSVILPRPVTESLARAINLLVNDKPEISEQVQTTLDKRLEVSLLANPDRFDSDNGSSALEKASETLTLVRAAASSSVQRAVAVSAAVLAFAFGYTVLTTSAAASYAGSPDPAEGSLERAVLIGSLTVAVGGMVLSEAARSTRAKLALYSSAVLERIASAFTETKVTLNEPGLKTSDSSGGSTYVIEMSDVPLPLRGDPAELDLATTLRWRGGLARYSIERTAGEVVPRAVDRFMNDVAEKLVGLGMDRVRISFLSFALYCAGAFALLSSFWYVSFSLILAGLLADVFDNRIAVVSPSSGSGDTRHMILWDHYLDRVGDLVLALGGWLAIGQDDPVRGLPVGLFAVGSLLASYSRAEAERLGVLCADVPGERALRLAVFLGFLAAGNPSAGFVVAGGLAFASAALRMTKALRV